MSAKDNKEENKNIDVKENERQVVVATYRTITPSSVFKVPKGKDIKKAHSYWVKWNSLYIYWTKEDEDNENIEQIRPHWNAEEDLDCKWPQETEAELAGDHNIESSDDDEE